MIAKAMNAHSPGAVLGRRVPVGGQGVEQLQRRRSQRGLFGGSSPSGADDQRRRTMSATAATKAADSMFVIRHMARALTTSIGAGRPELDGPPASPIAPRRPSSRSAVANSQASRGPDARRSVFPVLLRSSVELAGGHLLRGSDRVDSLARQHAAAMGARQPTAAGHAGLSDRSLECAAVNCRSISAKPKCGKRKFSSPVEHGRRPTITKAPRRLRIAVAEPPQG